MDYSYAVRGDAAQPQPEILPKGMQKQALQAALGCLDAETLTMSEKLMHIISPRPPGYYGIGELFTKRTGLAFDPLAAAEALTNFELGFLFNAERANRLVEFKARENNIGWDDVLDSIIAHTWKVAPAHLPT